MVHSVRSCFEVHEPVESERGELADRDRLHVPGEYGLDNVRAASQRGEHLTCSVQDPAVLLARTIQRAFERELAIPDAALRDLATATVTLLSDLIDADRVASGLPEA
ncbi:hypothetical protein [Microtetraspora sp. NBRC 16547]|uniref:hypothetical protein n=1 Tax=Microtetraspora sp. NBRC 16547 TaxID=3030993 RepID=UPI002554A8F3|nr:hypothetical protein [Microtetraspora sp. NBRC 16547]